MSDKVVRLREKPKARPDHRRGARRSQPSTAEVLDTLRQRIARQDIPPGAKLREHELADEFGVPRTRIREVFGALESRGLIERIPNRGAVVMRLDLAQVFQLYDVREVLEGLCVRLATENVPPETWQELVDHCSAGRWTSTSGTATSTPSSPATSACAQRIIECRAQRGRRPDARQHLREDQRRHPPHHHPAGPSRGRACASIAPCSPPCAAAMRPRPSG